MPPAPTAATHSLPLHLSDPRKPILFPLYSILRCALARALRQVTRCDQEVLSLHDRL